MDWHNVNSGERWGALHLNVLMKVLNISPVEMDLDLRYVSVSTDVLTV